MNPELRALASRQGGVFSRGQAKSSGCTERELKTRTGACGDWVVVRRGVYAERAVWGAAGEDERYRMRVHAGAVTSTRPAVASHTSAAAFLDIPVRPSWRQLLHVTRPGVTGTRTEGGIKHHLAAYDEADLVTVGPLTMTGLARTAIDIGREFGVEDGVVAADAALRQGVSRDGLLRILDRMRNWPYITRSRAAVAVADGGAQSIGETLMRLLVLELGIGTPETQFLAVEEGHRAFVDLRVGRHLFEFDGRVKYVGRDRGGVADKSPDQVLWDEKRREDWLRNYDGGYGMSRVVWAELFGAARDQTKQRLAREFAASQRRYGHLA